VNNPPRIGVVLSSGGNRGIYAHTGFLSAMENMGLSIAAIAGCSAGAVVGGIAASGADLHCWSKALAHLKPGQFWTPDSWLRIAWQIAVNKGRGYTGISSTDAAVDFCRSQLAVQNFEECKTPFYALAMSLCRGAKVVFSDGELAPRMVASAAMPMLYRPVEIDNDLYCDGATVELAPTEAICCRHQLDILIIHHVAASIKGHSETAGVLDNSWSMGEILGLLLFRQRPWYLSDKPLTFRQCPCGCKALIMVIEPDLPELPWPEAKRGPAVQAAARRQAETLLAAHLDHLLKDPQALHALVEAAGQKAGKDGPC